LALSTCPRVYAYRLYHAQLVRTLARHEPPYELQTIRSGCSGRGQSGPDPPNDEMHVAKLFPRHAQLDHHPLLPFGIGREMTMEEKAPAFFKVRACDGLPPRTIGIEGRRPQDDVLAVERAVALTHRHRRLPRVVPHRGEAIRFGIEARDSGAGALGSVGIDEGKIRNQKLAVLDHVLLRHAFCHPRRSVRREERLDDVPVARKLREQLLTGAGRVRRLIFLVGLLRDHGSGNEQRRSHPLCHRSRMISENREPCTNFRRWRMTRYPEVSSSVYLWHSVWVARIGRVHLFLAGSGQTGNSLCRSFVSYR